MNFKVRGKVNTKPLKEAKYDPDGDFEEYDMFVFITNLFTRDLKEPGKLPLNPLGRKHKHFEYTSRDGDSTYSPFAVDRDGNIVIGALKPEELDDVKEICNLYKFNYSEREGKGRTGNPVYYLTIVVPTYSRGDVPMSVDDYFESIGIPLEQVMPKWYLDNKAKFERDLVGVRESIDNLKRAIDGKEIDPAAALGVTMATAYNDSEDADKEIEKRMNAHKKETGIDYSKPFTGTAKPGETKKVSTPSLKKMHLSESLFEDVLTHDTGKSTDSLKEGYDEDIKIRDTFLDYIDEGIIDAKDAVLALVKWMSLDDVVGCLKANEFVFEDDEDDLDESKKLREWSDPDDYMEDRYNTYDIACRYLDAEIPDICSDTLAMLGDRDNAANLPTAVLNNIVGKCRRFYAEMESIAK